MPLLAPISLEQITIASPCTASWDEMTGDDRKRYCNQCRLHVYNLSGMTRDEAITLVSGASGRLCVRLYRRDDGTVMTRDCPVGLAAAREKLRRFASGLAALLGITALAGIASSQDEPEFPVQQSNVFSTLRKMILGSAPTPAVKGQWVYGDWGGPASRLQAPNKPGAAPHASSRRLID